MRRWIFRLIALRIGQFAWNRYQERQHSTDTTTRRRAVR